MKNISKEIRNYKDEILEDVTDIVGIPSIRADAKPGMPFGENSAKALDFCLNLGKSMGFKTKNVDGYAGHIEYGEGEELVGILAHCDVVAAGEGWNMDPFKAKIEDGKVYGRGAMDDKGPAIAAIYCLKALKDLGIKPKRRIRVIIGASEECGMEDMEHYFANEEMPTLAFSPDGDYPICNREKGIMHIEFTSKHDSNKVKSVHSGAAANIVPMDAKAVVDAVPAKDFEAAKDTAMTKGRGFNISVNGDSAEIESTGISAHGSTPEQGTNAAAGLLKVLETLFKDNAGTMTKFLTETIGYEYDGASMGVKCSDEESGPLTLNLGVLNFDKDGDHSIIDIRYPVTLHGDKIFETINKKSASYGVKANLISDSAPLFVDANNVLITRLKNAYKTVTGKDADLYASGGGTYARELECGVAFGPYMKDLSYYHIHGANEFFEIEDFMKHCEICLQAIYELACD